MTNSPGIVPRYKINTHMQIQRAWYSVQRQVRQEYLKRDINICNDGHEPYKHQAEGNSLEQRLTIFNILAISCICNEDDWEAHRSFVRWFFKWTSTHFWWLKIGSACDWCHNINPFNLPYKKKKNLWYVMDPMIRDKLRTSCATNLGTRDSI